MERLEVKIKLEAGGKSPEDMAMLKTALKKAIENDWNWNIAEDGTWVFDGTGQVERIADTYVWQKGIERDSEKAWRLDKTNNLAVDRQYVERITQHNYVEPTTANVTWAERLHGVTVDMIQRFKNKIQKSA